jgi:hypothetical protein
MAEFNFGVTFETNIETGKLLAVYFRIRNGKVAETREYADGNAFADFGEGGELLGVELIGPCNLRILQRLAPKDPKVKAFFRNKLPKEMQLV